MNLLIRFLVVLSSFQLVGQEYSDNKSDSLRNSLANSTENEEKLILNYQLGKYLIGKDTVGKKYLNQAIKIGLNDRSLGHHLSKAYWALGMHDNNIESMYDQQLDAQRKAVYYSGLYASRREVANVMVGLGNVFTDSNIDSSIYYFKEAAEIYDSLGIESAGLYENLGNSNFMIDGDPRVTIDYYKQAEQISYRTNDTLALGVLFYNISLAYNVIPEPDSVLHYLEKAFDFLDKHPETPYKLSKWKYYTRKAYLYYKLQNFKETIRNFELALPILIEEESHSFIADAYLITGSCYLQLNDIVKAKSFILKAFDYSEEHGLTKAKIQALSELHELNFLEKDYKSAYLNFGKMTKLQDSLESAKPKSDLYYEKELARNSESLKELENKLLKKEAKLQEATVKNQRIIVFVSIGGLIILSTFIASLLLSRMKIKRQNSDLTKANITIKNQRERLIELDTVKSTFFANVSHDLRSPLTLILGALDKIYEKDYEVLDKESRQLLDIGYKNTKRLVFLTDEIMELIRLEEGIIHLDLKNIKAKPYLKLLVKMFESAADMKAINLSFHSDLQDHLILRIDPSKFEKIIYNLLSNGLKFTPQGGEISVELTQTNEDIEITISDSGPGIPEDKLPFIFERGYQIDQPNNLAHVGVGIGLAIVEELVELLGGKITVESDENGTIFSIKMKEYKGDPDVGIVPEQSVGIITKNSLWMDLQEEEEGKMQVASLTNTDETAKTILIVEDHKELRAYLKSILSPHYRIYESHNGHQALNILKKEKIDLIVTDLMMPYLNGFELVEALKKEKGLKNLPVLILSARTDHKEKVQLVVKGVGGIMHKPFEKDELLARCKNLLERGRSHSNPLEELYISKADEFEKNILAKLERLVIKNIDNPNLSVLDLADEIAASESKIHRVLKKIAGLTPHEFIKEIRWQYLEDYLQNHKMSSAAKAAQLIGMKNSSYFITQYEKRFGRSIKEILS